MFLEVELRKHLKVPLDCGQIFRAEEPLVVLEHARGAVTPLSERPLIAELDKALS